MLKVLQTERGLCQAARELGENLKVRGLRYAEVRFAPQLHCQKGMSQEQAVTAVLSGLSKAQEDSDIRLRTILCCMREQDNKKANLQTVRLASRYLGKGVVAVDLAGAEALFPTADYEEEFALARKLGVPFTIHAGEAAGPASIRKAVEFGAARIGHGVRAIEDEELMEQIRLLAQQLSWNQPVRLLGVSVSHLVPAGSQSLALDDERRQKRNQALDALKQRFGEDIIRKGWGKP